MRLLKSLGAALMAAVAATIGAFLLLMVIGYAQMWVHMSGSSGGIGFYQSGLALPLLAGVAAGIAGFAWQWRRQRRRPLASA
jgi:hypothetical protein